MSLPEFGGMDTGFNYYHGADRPSTTSSSRTRRAASSVYASWAHGAPRRSLGRRHRVLRPPPGREAARRLLLRLRRQVPARLDGGDGRRAEPRRAEPRVRARRPRLPGRHGPRLADRRRAVQRLRAGDLAGADQPQHHAALARECLRLVLGAPVRAGRRGAAIVSNPYEGIERWFEPGEELLVVNDADEALRAYRAARRPEPGGGDGRRARERVLDEHTYAHRAKQLLSLVGLNAPVKTLRKLAIVPARNEEGAVGGVVSELRAFDPELDVVVIDDGSTDATAERAATAGAAVVRLPFNLGIGGGSRPVSSTRSSTGTRPSSGSTATASTTRRSCRACSARSSATRRTSSSARFADGNGDYKPPFAAPGSAGLRGSSRS